MKDNEFHSRLREAGWRRKLTESEQTVWRALLEANPDARADWELELALNTALTRLPDAPVPSNFTVRVLQAVEREEGQPHGWRWNWNWHTLLPRVAFAAVVLTFTGLAVHQYEINSRRTALVKSVALVTEGQAVPSPEALENFDAIRRMSQPQHADEELLALMQ